MVITGDRGAAGDLLVLIHPNSRAGFLIEDKIGSLGEFPTDYKVHVFQGVPKILTIFVDRGSAVVMQHFSFDGQYILGHNDEGVDLSDQITHIDELSAAAAALSCDLPYTRVDFYVEDDKLWFGEISPFAFFRGLDWSYSDLDKTMGGWWQ